MGLDVGFSIKAANAAGLTHYQGEANGGSEAAIERTIQGEFDDTGSIDPGYEDWLRKKPDLIDVPNAEHCVEVYISDEGMYWVRANKWGHTYAPLTEFLSEHGIEWSEC
jgi:hypothetical protein